MSKKCPKSQKFGFQVLGPIQMVTVHKMFECSLNNFLMFLDLVHAPGSLHPDGRHFALRRLLHRALLHLLSHLREPVLLSLRIPLPCLCHSGRLVLTDLHRHGLLPALR